MLALWANSIACALSWDSGKRSTSFTTWPPASRSLSIPASRLSLPAANTAPTSTESTNPAYWPEQRRLWKFRRRWLLSHGRAQRFFSTYPTRCASGNPHFLQTQRAQDTGCSPAAAALGCRRSLPLRVLSTPVNLRRFARNTGRRTSWGQQHRMWVCPLSLPVRVPQMSPPCNTNGGRTRPLMV